MTLPFDHKKPDYVSVLQWRTKRLAWIREDVDTRLPPLLAYYRDHVEDFISDWGMTTDPRNADIGLPVTMPFILFAKQREWVQWVIAGWRAREHGVTEKSREVGVSWLAVSTAVSLCLFHREMTIGFGSRKAEYVDRLNFPKSLFWKARRFAEKLPPEFTGGWRSNLHSVEMRLSFPTTGSVITGEAGDGIGRGDRAAIYFVDESAHLERPALVDASLSATTNCRIDISSANGTDNSFYDKVKNYPAHRVFTLHWRDDPRKDDAWYQKQLEYLDPVTVAQEIDINYSASKVGILIPQPWVQAAVDADKKLGLQFTGAKRCALDIADEGIDLNALAMATGVYVNDVQAWSGKGSDTFYTAQHAFLLCDEFGADELDYDADGLGAGFRGDARVINDGRPDERQLRVKAFRGSGEVHDKEKPIPTALVGFAGREVTPRLNGDFFLNAKAQAWWNLRVRFQRTFRAVEAVRNGEACPYDADDLIALNGKMAAIGKVTTELSQPTYTQTVAGKIVVDKTPDTADGRPGKSPNHADAIMIRMAPRRASFLTAI